MSRINDALKQARQAAPPATPQPFAPPGIPLRREEKSPVLGWLIFGILILLGLAGLAYFGRSSFRHQVTEVAVAPTPVAPPPAAVVPAATASAVSATPAVAPVAAVPPTNPPAAPAPPPLPVLQGIFYSPTDPSAIVSGKTVRPGSRLGSYIVKAIDSSVVTLIGSDKQEIKLGIGH
jgi:hypothetical protein